MRELWSIISTEAACLKITSMGHSKTGILSAVKRIAAQLKGM